MVVGLCTARFYIQCCGSQLAENKDPTLEENAEMDPDPAYEKKTDTGPIVHKKTIKGLLVNTKNANTFTGKQGKESIDVKNLIFKETA